ncbi:MAG: Gfo/Idh/MocA family oxidoreductase [Thermoleophilia bacterium]|nr:Gfo/Idh/MocA family oxidoreductase [Thermoleophilia bacterium]
MKKVAIIGYGYWGPNLLRNYMELAGAWVEWVCDSRPEALAKAACRYPAVAGTTDYEQVLADPKVDAVVIATPISSHFSLARAALLAGKHVFVEKPMTGGTAEARELVELAALRGLTLMVGHTFVFSPPVRKVKEIIDAGELGDIFFITSSRVNLGLHQKDVSVVWDLAPHDLSILHYWLGETPSTVSVAGRACINPGIPDVAFINLRFPSGILAELEVAWLSPVKLRRTVVVGSKKMLLYDDTESVEKVKIFDHGVDFRDPETFGEYQLSYRTGDILSPKVGGSEPLFVEASHFIECLETSTPPITDGAAGLAVVASLEAADWSLRNDGASQTIGLPVPATGDAGS